MRPALWLPFLGIGLLATSSCSSSLDEFRCTANTECVEDGTDGVCHSSGYCAFVDEEECDGLRFGKHSGEQSGQCVGASVADAGPSRPDAAADIPDAAPNATPPTANINPISLSCSNTRILPNGRNSQAADGQSLVEFTWTLRSPSGTVLETLVGAPADAFRPNAHFLTGAVEQPGVNLTPYMDGHSVFVDTDEDDAVLFQNELDIPPGSWRVSFAAASEAGEDTSRPFIFGVGASSTEVEAEDSVTLTEEMTHYTLDFTSDTGVSQTAVYFFTDVGEFWVDNVRLHKLDGDASQDAPILMNTSFEDALNPWDDSLDNPTAHSERRELPPYLAQYGDYTIQLVVKDSQGLSSEPVARTVNHAACP